MKKFIPGLRIIKTVVAVLLCLLFFFSLGYYKPMHAAIACVLMMRANSDETKKVGLNRMIGTLLGGIISYFTLVIITSLKIDKTTLISPIIMSVALLISFMISKGFSLDPYVASMSGVVLLITLLGHSDGLSNIFTYVSIRTLETLAGIVIAYLVNKYFDSKWLDKDQDNETELWI